MRLLTLLLLSTQLFTLPSPHCFFLPENNLAIPTGIKNQGLTFDQYNAVIDKVEKVYSPIAASYGKKIQFNRLWESPIVNAGTYPKGDTWIINLYGGYARHPAISEDGYALVLCHEIGHHIGGAPKKESVKWSSGEGQADYFATLKCLRRVFRKDDNIAIVANMQDIPAAITDKCHGPFKEEWESALCIRTTMAGISPGNISADIRGTIPPDISNSDSGTVEELFTGYPEPQCRLDTYFMGSVCEVGSNLRVSQTDEAINTCHEKNGYTVGLRPKCWHK